MKWRSLMIFTLALGLGLGAPLSAQDEDEKECDCRREWTVRAPVRFRADDWLNVWVGNRVRLGIWVETRADSDRDKLGAEVTRVASGGPAEKAGIEAGDIITKLDGESLLRGSESYEDDEAAPAMRLLERAPKLEDGDTVEVEYLRDGKSHTTTLVAGDFDNEFTFGDEVVRFDELGDQVRVLVRRLRELPRVEIRAPNVTYFGPESFAVRVGSAIPGRQHVSLNPDLGDYFGVEEGVLVLSVPEDSELGLEAGDVLLKIDGRTVNSPSHAMRILRTYDSDEKLSLDIRRKNKNQTVEGPIPERLHSRVIDIHPDENK